MLLPALGDNNQGLERRFDLMEQYSTPSGRDARKGWVSNWATHDVE